MELSIKYSELNNAALEAGKLATELENYATELSSKVQSKINSVEGGSSTDLNNANYYVNNKINAIKKKSQSASDLSRLISQLSSVAQSADEAVQKLIETNQSTFFSTHEDLRPESWKTAVIGFICDIKNIPLLGWLIQAWEDTTESFMDFCRSVRHWYECDGGREVIGVVLAIGEAVVAVALLVVACCASGGIVFVVAGIVGAVIGLANALVNVHTSLKSLEMESSGDHCRSGVLAELDTLSDYMRSYNAKNKLLNNLLDIGAFGLDVTEFVCDVIGLVGDGIELNKTLDEMPLSDMFSLYDTKGTKGGLKTIFAGKWDSIKDAFKHPGKSLVEFVKDGDNWEAAKDLIDDLKDMNSGEMSFLDFSLKQALNSAISLGSDLYISKFDSSSYEFGFDAINKTGVFDLLAGTLTNGDNVSNIFGFEEGWIKDVSDLIENGSNLFNGSGVAVDPNANLNINTAFTAPDINVTVPNLNVNTPNMGINAARPDIDVTIPNLNVSTPNVGINAARPDIDVTIPNLNVSTPNVGINVSRPDIDVTIPNLNVSTPNVGINVPRPEVGVTIPNVSAPQVSAATGWQAQGGVKADCVIAINRDILSQSYVMPSIGISFSLDVAFSVTAAR